LCTCKPGSHLFPDRGIFGSGCIEALAADDVWLPPVRDVDPELPRPKEGVLKNHTAHNRIGGKVGGGALANTPHELLKASDAVLCFERSPCDRGRQGAVLQEPPTTDDEIQRAMELEEE